MDDAITHYTTISEGAGVVPILATPGAASVVRQWTRGQALKAAHEASHAVIAALLEPPLGPIATYEVSIKGQWSGKTRLVDGEDTMPSWETASRKRGLMAVAFAGLEGERELFGEATDGSGVDLETASGLAASLISAGLHPEASLVDWQPFGYQISPPRWLVEERYRLAERELRRARDLARELVAAHREQVLGFARILFEKRRMETADIDAALAEVGIAPVERQP